jgi:aspartate aminotransferase
MATVNPGDEVIIGAPYWTSYIDMIQVAGGVPVVVPCFEENGFRMTAEQLEEAISPKTRWLLLNSPSNPSGACYTKDIYLELIQVLRDNPHVMLMADDIYEHVTYDTQFVTPLQLAPDLRDRCLVVNGVSKAYAMTGWRIGYGAGPKELIKAMIVIQSNSTSAPSSISQAAMIEALCGPQDVLAERRESFKARRDFVVETLNKIDGISCLRPDGAFYVYPNCAGVLGKTTPDGTLIETDADYCRFLLDDTFVAVVPGSAFGLSPYFRISYATSLANLEDALERIAQSTAKLS